MNAIEEVFGSCVKEEIINIAKQEAERAAIYTGVYDEVQQAQQSASSTGKQTGSADIKFNSENAAHITRLLNIKNSSGQYALKTASVVKGEISKKTGKTVQDLSDANEDWVLLVELIVWLTIFPEGTDAVGIHSKIYRTITNIVQAFNTDQILKPYANKRPFNYKALNSPV